MKTKPSLETLTCKCAFFSLLLFSIQTHASPISTPLSTPLRHTTSKHHINIGITSHLGDKQTYKEGDVISFYLSLDRDAFVIIIYQDATGNLTQIIPNELSRNNFYLAGDFFNVPNAESPFKFVINKPFGTEYLWAFANDKALPTLKGKKLKNGFIALKTSMKKIKEILDKFGKESNGYFGQTSTSITTIAAQP